MSLITSAQVSRAAPLTTSPLSIHSGAYRIVGADGLDPGGIQWERKSAGSPWVHGEYPVHQRKRNSRGAIRVKVTAATQSDLNSAKAALLDAFYQFQYDLTVVIDGQTYSWRCFAADATVGMADERWMNKNIEVNLMFDRLPTPLQGPI